MGWASGSRLAEGIIDALNNANISIDDLDRRELYLDLIDLFEDADCDTLDEIEDPTFAAIYDAKNR